MSLSQNWQVLSLISATTCPKTWHLHLPEASWCKYPFFCSSEAYIVIYWQYAYPVMSLFKVSSFVVSRFYTFLLDLFHPQLGSWQFWWQDFFINLFDLSNSLFFYFVTTWTIFSSLILPGFTSILILSFTFGYILCFTSGFIWFFSITGLSRLEIRS